jgi:hypothetical protein
LGDGGRKITQLWVDLLQLWLEDLPWVFFSSVCCKTSFFALTACC